MVKNLILVPILACLAPQFFFVGFNSSRCKTLFQAIIEYNFKEN